MWLNFICVKMTLLDVFRNEDDACAYKEVEVEILTNGKL